MYHHYTILKISYMIYGYNDNGLKGLFMWHRFLQMAGSLKKFIHPQACYAMMHTLFKTVTFLYFLFQGWQD
jgi:hypothetical protein